jgi:hypothetical protein
VSAALIVLWAVAGGCAPDQKCSGEQYYDSVTELCRVCPMEATFKNGTCKCKAQYQFVNMRCVLMADAMSGPPDTGANDSGTVDAGTVDTGMPETGGPSGAGCVEYCDFATSCIGANPIAKAALPDIVSGIHADNEATCTSSCNSALDGEGAGDPFVACIEAGREEAACAGVSNQAAFAAAMTLVGDCCRPRQDNALCKSICVPLKANQLTSSMADFCK